MPNEWEISFKGKLFYGCLSFSILLSICLTKSISPSDNSFLVFSLYFSYSAFAFSSASLWLIIPAFCKISLPVIVTKSSQRSIQSFIYIGLLFSACNSANSK